MSLGATMCYAELHPLNMQVSPIHGFESQISPYYDPWAPSSIPMLVGFTVVVWQVMVWTHKAEGFHGF